MKFTRNKNLKELDIRLSFKKASEILFSLNSLIDFEMKQNLELRYFNDFLRREYNLLENEIVINKLKKSL